MNNIIINGTQNFMGIEIPVVEGGFGKGKKSICDNTIGEIHNQPIPEIRRRLNDNIKRFKEGVDFIDLKVMAESHNNLELLQSLGYSKMQVSKAKNIYLLSERGYAKLIKIMDTDLAWEIHDKLIDEYFTMRRIINSNVQEPEDELMILSKAILIADNKIKEQAAIIDHQDEQLSAIPQLIPLGTVKREHGRNLEESLIRLGYVVYKDARIVKYDHKYLVCGNKQIHVIKDNLHELLYRLSHDINTNGDVEPRSKLFAKNK